jgi:hypothetical protein
MYAESPLLFLRPDKYTWLTLGSILVMDNLFSHIIMPLCAIYCDLKAWIPVLFYEQDLTVDWFVSFWVSRSPRYIRACSISVYMALHITLTPTRSVTIRLSLSLIDIKFIAALMDQRHCIYLDETHQALSEHRGHEVSVSTLLHTLRHLNFS